MFLSLDLRSRVYPKQIHENTVEKLSTRGWVTCDSITRGSSCLGLAWLSFAWSPCLMFPVLKCSPRFCVAEYSYYFASLIYFATEFFCSAHIYIRHMMSIKYICGEKFFASEIQTHSFAAPHIHHQETNINKRKINYQGINFQILISSNLLLMKLVEFYKTRQLSYLLSKSKNI